MNSGCSSAAGWRALYGAVLVELDKDKLPLLVASAHQALGERLRELSRVPCRHIAELLAIFEALRTLAGLLDISGNDA